MILWLRVMVRVTVWHRHRPKVEFCHISCTCALNSIRFYSDRIEFNNGYGSMKLTNEFMLVIYEVPSWQSKGNFNNVFWELNIDELTLI